jgi:hypothetical protein
MNILSRIWYQLTRARQSSTRTPLGEEPTDDRKSRVLGTLAKVDLGKHNDQLVTQNQVPRAQFMRYQGEQVSDNTLQWAQSSPALVLDVNNLAHMAKELAHYRENMRGYEEIEALFWLAARDIVFFATYDEDVHDWTNGFSLAINVNDTFYYASADAEQLKLKDTVSLKRLYQTFGYSGIEAYVAMSRDMEVLPELRTERYKEARAYIEREGWIVKPDEESA